MDKIYTVIIVNRLNDPAFIVAVKSFESFNEAKKCQQEIFDEEYLAMCEMFKCENIEKYIGTFEIYLKGTTRSEQVEIIETFI